MNWLDRVVPPMDPVEWASGELYSLQEWLGSLRPSTGIRGDCIGIYDALRAVQGYDLEDEDFEEYTCLTHFKYMQENSLRL